MLHGGSMGDTEVVGVRSSTLVPMRLVTARVLSRYIHTLKSKKEFIFTTSIYLVAFPPGGEGLDCFTSPAALSHPSVEST